VLVASSARATEVLGWRAAHDDVEEIIETAWNWRCANPEGYRG